MNHAIEVRSLSHRYGRGPEILSGLNLAVPEGSFFGLLGPNGAGKTTLIDILMNLLPSTDGDVRLLGVPSQRLGPEELAQIGYVSADQQLPDGLTVQGLCKYLEPLYPTWDTAFAKELMVRYHLPRKRKIRKLSRGERMKAALLSVLAYRPKLLILDEPFHGLDAMVQQTVVESLLDPSLREDRTVFISSHDLEGLEPLVDRMGILRGGQLVLEDSIEALAERYRRVDVFFPDAVEVPNPLPAHWLDWQTSSRVARFLDSRFESVEALEALFPGAQRVEVSEIRLRELFLAVSHHWEPLPEGF